MKYFYFLLLLFGVTQNIYSQTLGQGSIIFSDGALSPVPNQLYWYEFQTSSDGSATTNCQYSWSIPGHNLITDETGDVSGPSNEKRIYVKWLNHPGNNITINIILTVSGCSVTKLNSAAGGYQREVNVKYLATPVFQTAGGSTITTLNVPCYQTSVNLKVASNPNATTYWWQLPNGWTINGQNPAQTGTPSAIATVTQGISNTSITAWTTVGTFTGPSTTLPVTRNPDQISFVGENPVVYCVSTDPISYEVTNIPNLSYTWNYPSGWSCTSGCNGNRITLQPNGSDVTGQTIQATASTTCSGQTISTNTPSRTINLSTDVPTNIQVSGQSLICGDGAQYTVTNVIGSLPITWQATPVKNFITTTGTGTSFFAQPKPTGSGFSAIIATVQSGCGNITIPSKQVWLGPPSITYVPAGSNPCTNNAYYLAPVISGAVYNWETNNPNVWGTTSGYPSIALISSTEEYFDLTITMAHGTCALTNTLTNQFIDDLYCTCFEDINCPGQSGLFSIFPNPSADFIELSIEDEKITESKNLSYMYEYSILNRSGNVVKSGSNNSKKLRIGLNELPQNLYFFKLKAKGKTETAQFSIKK